MGGTVAQYCRKNPDFLYSAGRRLETPWSEGDLYTGHVTLHGVVYLDKLSSGGLHVNYLEHHLCGVGLVDVLHCEHYLRGPGLDGEPLAGPDSWPLYHPHPYLHHDDGCGDRQ